MLNIFGKSICGRRKNNQDSIYFETKDDCFIMAVSDGVGGSYGGEIASEIVVCQCRDVFLEFAEKPDIYNGKFIIRQIYFRSHKNIVNEIKKNPKLKDMGTTLTLVLGYNDRYVVGNIGDSRTYLISNDKINKITRDHSYLQEYMDQFANGEIPPMIARQLGHIITRSISSIQEEIDIYPSNFNYFKVKDNEIFLLCSDGLFTDIVHPDSHFIIDELNCSKSMEEFVENLIEKSLHMGSMDNISTIVGSNSEKYWR